MSLSVPVQKDLAEYEPKFMGKLTKRTVVSIAVGAGMALLAGLYLIYVIRVDIDEYGIFVMLAAAPGWAIGFWKPDKMRPEVWTPLWLKHSFTPDEVLYRRTFADKTEPATLRKEDRLDLRNERKLIHALNERASELLCPTDLFR